MCLIHNLEGKKVNVRVLTRDIDNKKIELTMKPLLLDETLLVLSNKKQAKKAQEYYGFVNNVKDNVRNR